MPSRTNDELEISYPKPKPPVTVEHSLVRTSRCWCEQPSYTPFAYSVRLVRNWSGEFNKKVLPVAVLEQLLGVGDIAFHKV